MSTTTTIVTTTFAVDWTLAVAIYAAFVATAVFLWDVFKYKNAGPRLNVRVQTGMKTLNIPQYEGMSLMIMHVTNRGDRSTTLENMSVQQYDTWLRALRNKPNQSWFVSSPSISHPIPYVLQPGTTWMGMIEESADFVKMANDSFLYLNLHESHGNKAYRRRVKPKARVED